MSVCLGALFCAVPASAAMSVSVSPSVPSPQPIGTPVIWTASVSGASPGTLWYRFRTRFAGFKSHLPGPAFDYRTVIDYGPNSSFTWSTIAGEGKYRIEASVENNTTGEIAAITQEFILTSLAANGPVLTPTVHPLVFLYSAPSCRGQMRVQFTSAGGSVQTTPYQACDGRTSMNFYLAGMRANTTYTVQQEMNGGSDPPAPQLSLTTASIAIQTPQISVLTAPAPVTGGPILLHDVVNTNGFATDLSGNVIWYVPFPLTLMTNVVPGGTFLGIVEDGTKDSSQQTLQEFDLTGAIVAETNAARVSQQLNAIGMHSINCFHHDAIKLSNGDYLVLGGSERILAGVQGPGPVDILGDTILVLDPNLQVRWAWDAFDHLDPHRAAVLGETCTYPGTPSCTVFYLSNTANDWLHGNALQLLPDGAILYSSRHQDWVMKIDYRNGAGTGNILWKMGVDGDFQIQSSDPYPWFSHQHDPNFLADGQTLLVFDNGNTRISKNPGEFSRAQVYHIDQQNLVATPVINTDLGVNSSALGTALLLQDGNYHYDAGFMPNPTNPASLITQLYELDNTGNIFWTMQVYAEEYRNFRMNDLYTPPVDWLP
ncbi:MAG TPA: aryl-sulfate sulfotransferase [Bryobacteraceae bacterium]|nr:aryl-sulfate sulfotransferase [Bryobacteraceae bacterium]